MSSKNEEAAEGRLYLFFFSYFNLFSVRILCEEVSNSKLKITVLLCTISRPTFTPVLVLPTVKFIML